MITKIKKTSYEIKDLHIESKIVIIIYVQLESYRKVQYYRILYQIAICLPISSW